VTGRQQGLVDRDGAGVVQQLVGHGLVRQGGQARHPAGQWIVQAQAAVLGEQQHRGGAELLGQEATSNVVDGVSGRAVVRSAEP
jgi:hypothetical protein